MLLLPFTFMITLKILDLKHLNHHKLGTIYCIKSSINIEIVIE